MSIRYSNSQLTLRFAIIFIALSSLVHAGDAIPDLPEAISNNATTILSEPDQHFRLYSFFGLGEGKTWRDVSKNAYEYQSKTNAWRKLESPPVPQGRLASLAVTAGQSIYLFGGYTVSENGDESSTPDVLRFNPETNEYTHLAPMPVPVDDSVAVVYKQRWIILVSGWHEKDNVKWVQVYDIANNTWSRSTDWPGKPVFGHAASLHDNALIVCDGVMLILSPEGKRQYSASNQCWRGDISESETVHINWSPAPAHPGLPRYRMGANAHNSLAYFAGGSDNPYNFNGIGYNGTPSQASAVINVFDFTSNTWLENQKLSQASMDHRALPCKLQTCYLIGGMSNPQQVNKKVNKITLLGK